MHNGQQWEQNSPNRVSWIPNINNTGFAEWNQQSQFLMTNTSYASIGSIGGSTVADARRMPPLPKGPNSFILIYNFFET